jgi:hypothetical protein
MTKSAEVLFVPELTACLYCVEVMNLCARTVVALNTDRISTED